MTSNILHSTILACGAVAGTCHFLNSPKADQMKRFAIGIGLAATALYGYLELTKPAETPATHTKPDTAGIVISQSSQTAQELPTSLPTPAATNTPTNKPLVSCLKKPEPKREEASVQYNEKLTPQLFNAVKNTDFAKVNQLLNARANPDAINAEGITLITEANGQLIAHANSYFATHREHKMLKQQKIREAKQIVDRIHAASQGLAYPVKKYKIKPSFLVRLKDSLRKKKSTPPDIHPPRTSVIKWGHTNECKTYYLADKNLKNGTHSTINMKTHSEPGVVREL